MSGLRMSRVGRVATKFVKDAIRRSGFEVQRSRPDFHYTLDYYGRSFAQRTDLRGTPIFGELAAEVIREGRSCLYYDRLYILFEAMMNLRRYAAQVTPFRIVEVGVYKGGTSAYLARLTSALGLAAEIHSFDTFEGHSAVDVDEQKDPIHKPGDFHDTSFDAVAAYLRPYSNVQVYRGRFEDRCGSLAGAPICMMHLDVDLYGPTLHALELAEQQLVTGGMVIVDDYEVTNCPGVKSAVDDFLRAHPRYFAIHPMTEQCVLVKLGTP
jgi:O-methyltransferase